MASSRQRGERSGACPLANGTDIYVGGSFVTAGTDTVWGIARWDGSAWHSLGIGVHKDINFVAVPTVRGLYGSAEGLYLGGDFTHAGRNYSNRIALWTDFSPVSAVSEETVPTEFRLLQNYPNPFNPSTTIRYELPIPSIVRLSVYDLLGRELSVIVNEWEDVGPYEVVFNASALSSGIYLYRLVAGDYVATNKFVVIR